MKTIRTCAVGVLLCVVIAALASCVSGLTVCGFSMEIIGSPVLSIAAGMLLGLAAPELARGVRTRPGIHFASKQILQWAVVGLGFSMNLGTIAEVGGKSLPIIVTTITVSLAVAWVGMHLLRVPARIACLVGVGSSICGGSAIAAAAPVIDADDEEVAQSISVIFLYNVLAALIFPAFGHWLGLGSEGFAIFAGTAVNDTSSVTAAASTAELIYGVDGILSTAVTVKLTRTLAILPVTLGLALYKARRSGDGKLKWKAAFPRFILHFVAASLVTTLMCVLPQGEVTAVYLDSFVPFMKSLARFFIAMAMGAIGLNTDLRNLIKKGGRPMILGLCCWGAITAVSLGMQLATGVFATDLPA